MLIGVFVSVYVFCAVFFAFNKSVTFDEACHLGAAAVALHDRDFAFYPQNPPFYRMFCTLPWLVMGVQVPPREERDYDEVRGIKLINRIAELYPGEFHRLVVWARMMNLAVTVVLGLLVFHDCRRRWGEVAGFACAAFYFLQPVLIAHGGFMSLDAGAAFIFYIFLRTWVRFRERGFTWLRAVILGGLLGLAVAIKFSNLTLFLVIPALYLAELARGGGKAGRNRGKPAFGPAVFRVFLGLFCGWLVLNGSYTFQGTFTRLEHHRFLSEAGQKAAEALPARLPALLPYFLVQGIDYQRRDNERLGKGHGRTFWMGRWVSGKLPLYFPFVTAVKLTIPLLLFVLLSMGFQAGEAVRARSLSRFFEYRLFSACLIGSLIHFLVIAYVVELYFSFRYLLQMVPLFAMMGGWAAARYVSLVKRRGWLEPGLVLFLSASGFFSVFSQFPHFLAYNNLLLGGEERQERLDPDKSRYSGQDLIELKRWLDTHPGKPLYLAYYGVIDPVHYGIEWELPPPRPAAGMWAVSMNYLLDPKEHESITIVRGHKILNSRPVKGGYFAWLGGRKPIAKIGPSLAVFWFTESDLAVKAQAVQAGKK